MPRNPTTALRWVLGTALVLTLTAALYLTAQGLGLWEVPGGGQVKGLGDAEQEIAWIEPATNTDDWAQFIAGLNRLQADSPGIRGPLGELHADPGPAPPGRSRTRPPTSPP